EVTVRLALPSTVRTSVTRPKGGKPCRAFRARVTGSCSQSSQSPRRSPPHSQTVARRSASSQSQAGGRSRGAPSGPGHSSREIPFLFVQPFRPLGELLDVFVLPGKTQHVSEIEQHACALVQRIRAFRSRRNRMRCAQRTIVLAVSREELRTNRLPGESGVEVVVGRSALRSAGPRACFLISTLRVQRSRELSGTSCEGAVQTSALEQLAALEQDQLCSLPVSRENLDRTADATAQCGGWAELTELVESLPGTGHRGASVIELPAHREQSSEEDQDVGLGRGANGVATEKLLAPCDRLWCRRRSLVERQGKLPETGRGRQTGSAVSLERPFARLDPRCAVKVTATLDEAGEKPRAAECTVVAKRLEARDRVLRDSQHLVAARFAVL